MKGQTDSGKGAEAREQDMLDTAARAVQSARRRGAQEAAATATLAREVEVSWRDGKLEKITESTQRALGLQLFVDGRYSAVTTSDLRPSALEEFIDNAIRMTRVLAKDPLRALPEAALYGPFGEGAAQKAPALPLSDEGYAGLSAQARRDRARDLEAAARAVPGHEAFLSVTAGVGDSSTERHRVSSNGFRGSERSTDFYLSTDVSIKDKDGRRPEESDFAHARFLADLPAPARVGQQAAQRALSRLGARKAPSAVIPMLVENRAAGRLLRYLLEPLSGQALQQGKSFYEGKVGAQVASDKLTLVDDPLLARALGSRLFDNEGLFARRLALLERGVLRGFYIDSYYGKKLKMAPTTGRPSNITLAPGDRDLAGLMAGVKDGILVTGFIGGNSNSTTGDFSLGVLGFRVRDGKRAEAVSEMNIAGNHLELWKRLAAVGNDAYVYSPLRSPSLLFDQVQFAGV